MRSATVRSSTPLWAAVAVLGAGISGQAFAAPTEAVTKIYVLEVPPAMDHDFRNGIRSWDKCLQAHKAAFTLQAYDAESGDLSRYAFLEAHRSWGGLDTHDPASKACAATFREDVLPHFTQAHAEFAQPTAKITYMPEAQSAPAPFVWVDVYRFKPGQERNYIDVATKFTAAAAKVHYNQPYIGYEVFGSGSNGPQLLLVGPGKNWAEIGADPVPAPDKMMSEVYGKAPAKAMRDKAMAAIAHHSADAWSYDKELSYIPKQ